MPRPEVDEPIYDAMLELANKHSAIKIKDFNDACIIVLGLLKHRDKKQ